jgi:RHS repeat-associated protein
VKYHLGDHLGSSNLVIGGPTPAANDFINREEYTPYGETSFGSFAKKRYRFTGKERDEESGLYYHGARYYAPWLARWVSCDPKGMVDGENLYRYARDNPIKFVDPSGRAGEEPKPAHAEAQVNGSAPTSSQQTAENKISTPVPSGAVKQPDGSFSLKINNVKVIIKPDVPDVPNLKSSAKTVPTVTGEFGRPSPHPNFPKEFVKPQKPSVTLTIQTKYAKGVNPNEPSALGRHPREDIALGPNKSEVHEGSHGQDFMEFMKTHPLPEFSKGDLLTPNEYNKAKKDNGAALKDYKKRMEAVSMQRTDFVGIHLIPIHLQINDLVRAR